MSRSLPVFGVPVLRGALGRLLGAVALALLFSGAATPAFAQAVPPQRRRRCSASDPNARRAGDRRRPVVLFQVRGDRRSRPDRRAAEMA